MIRTVTGDINTSDVKNVFIHEHIQCASNDMLHIFGKDWIDTDKLSDYASEILIQINKKWNVNLIVDGTPIDLGRDIKLLKSVSEKSGTYIVASTGLYYYPSCVTGGNGEAEIASWFLKECNEGAENTGVFPGILKCAVPWEEITSDAKKRMTAMAYVAKETQLPIYVHCPHKGSIAQEQIEILLKNGVKPSQIIIGHCAIRPNADYIRDILNSGCYISMDQCHCSGSTPAEIALCLYELCNKGYSSKLILSNDICIYSDFPHRKYNGLHLTQEEQSEIFGFNFKKILPEFEAVGGKEEDIIKMLRDNALEVLNV